MTIQTQLTGEPFVDIGALVMETIPGDSVEEKIRFITDVYVDKWEGKINAVFLHSKITTIHAKGKPEQQRKNSLDYYLKGVLGERESVISGYCRICSDTGALFECGRTNYPLSGSGEFVNFHHFHEEGVYICKNCLIKIYFSPMGFLQSGGKLILLQVQTQFTKDFWKDEVIIQNLDKIGKGTSEGIIASAYYNPQSSLFELARKMIIHFEHRDLPSQRLRLYYFTNFATKPEIEIYDLPNSVFAFLQRVLIADLKKDWYIFVRKHYRFSQNFKFDPNPGDWFENKKNETVKLDSDNYTGSRSNQIYDKLLNGDSILKELYRMHKTGKFSIMITIHYLKEVRKMRQERINSIKELADKIIEICQKNNDFKKYLTPIEGARRPYELRTAIVKMAKKCCRDEENEPLVRFNDFVEHLFPDGNSWTETRDFLLIRLYEKIHELNIDSELISDNDISEPETDNIELINN
jgi:CRISPR-associated protein Cst1